MPRCTPGARRHRVPAILPSASRVPGRARRPPCVGSYGPCPRRTPKSSGEAHRGRASFGRAARCRLGTGGDRRGQRHGARCRSPSRLPRRLPGSPHLALRPALSRSRLPTRPSAGSTTLAAIWVAEDARRSSARSGPLVLPSTGRWGTCASAHTRAALLGLRSTKERRPPRPLKRGPVSAHIGL